MVRIVRTNKSNTVGIVSSNVSNHTLKRALVSSDVFMSTELLEKDDFAI